jgi:hypothetical protein
MPFSFSFRLDLPETHRRDTERTELRIFDQQFSELCGLCAFVVNIALWVMTYPGNVKQFVRHLMAVRGRSSLVVAIKDLLELCQRLRFDLKQSMDDVVQFLAADRVNGKV